MQENSKVSFFKYDKKLFALLEVTGPEHSCLPKIGGGYSYKDKEFGFTGLVIDGNLPPGKKSRILHRLIKCKKMRKIDFN